MTDYCETVTIKTPNGPVRINAVDFDPKQHEIHKDDKVELPVTDANTFVAAAPVPLSASAIVATQEAAEHNTLEGKRPVALEPAQPASDTAPSVSNTVVKRGRKFFVVDAKGEDVKGVDGIDEAGYSTEAEAWKVAAPSLAG